MWGVLQSLIAALIGAGITWAWRSWQQRRFRRGRLAQLHQAAESTDIAVCVRVGGGGDPVRDVQHYLVEHRPEIRQILVYDVLSNSPPLEDPRTAQRIAEDIRELVQMCGKAGSGRAEIHLFCAGMIVYSLVVAAGILNGCAGIKVYQKVRNTYVPLYEMDKEWIRQEERHFTPVQQWDILSLPVAPQSLQPSQLSNSPENSKVE